MDSSNFQLETTTTTLRGELSSVTNISWRTVAALEKCHKKQRFLSANYNMGQRHLAWPVRGQAVGEVIQVGPESVFLFTVVVVILFVLGLGVTVPIAEVSPEESAVS